MYILKCNLYNDVLVRKRFGKHSRKCSTFPIAIMKGIQLFPAMNSSEVKVYKRGALIKAWYCDGIENGHC